MSTYADCLQQVGNDDKNDQVLECIAIELQANAELLTTTSNVFFLIYSASLVFLMQAGFAMICSGSVRKNNVQNTMLKNLLDACGAAIAFFSFGCELRRSFVMDYHYSLLPPLMNQYSILLSVISFSHSRCLCFW